MSRISESWWLAGNMDNVSDNLLDRIDAGEDIAALLVRQECNIAGQHCRPFVTRLTPAGDTARPLRIILRKELTCYRTDR
ncbi:hypothetical protein EON65_41335 [archaeon]|nr:MAG: hypothetical protein EON65_41335 [archaeon]